MTARIGLIVVPWAVCCACGSLNSNSDDTDSAKDSESSGDTSADAGDQLPEECASAIDTAEGSLFNQMSEGFTVHLWEGEGSFEGGVLSGPPLTFHKESSHIGDCRLLTYEAAACTEICDLYQRCANGECVSDTPATPLGPVTVRDSNGFEAVVSPEDTNTYYMHDTGFTVQNNEWVTMALSVSDNPVALTTCVPQPLVEETPFNDIFNARKAGEDVVLEWTEREEFARMYLRMTTCIGSHGGISPVEIECEARDKGELTIPGAFLDAFEDCPQCWSMGECGTHDLMRYHTDETEAGDVLIRMNNVQSVQFSYFPGRSWT